MIKLKTMGFYNNFTNCNIDNLQLSRLGLTVIDNGEGCDPFGDYEEFCKEFSIIDLMKPLTKNQCKYIKFS